MPSNGYTITGTALETAAARIRGRCDCPSLGSFRCCQGFGGTSRPGRQGKQKSGSKRVTGLLQSGTGCHGSCHGSRVSKGPSLLGCHGVTGLDPGGGPCNAERGWERAFAGAFGESALVFRKTFRTMWDKRIFKYNP